MRTLVQGAKNSRILKTFIHVLMAHPEAGGSAEMKVLGIPYHGVFVLF